MTTSAPARTATYRLFEVELAARQQLSPHFVRLTFTGPELDSCGDTCLDQRVKLVFAEEGQIGPAVSAGEDWYAWWLGLEDDRRPAMRTYTMRAVRPEASEVDIDFACHGTEGPASAFAVQAPLGSRLLLVAPDATVPGSGSVGLAWHPGAATDVLLVGDETAAPAICGIVQRLGEDVTGRVLLEVPTAADALPLRAPAGVSVTWLARDDRPHGERLVAAVREWATCLDPAVAPGEQDVPAEAEELLWDEVEPAGDRYVWVAAEAGTVAAVRRHLVRERGVDKASCSFMGYWKAGRAG
ncbi:siderophore-interacting protein [Desertihabitans aurantiacus]|uniref:siderophore-interacting protein n=1 Tax=Desertihabitans aurantiacus TaxID=2282477 RepID=UPI000DF7D756|nr:siderophore-interacting protein [Desertihabitans aurantiacus]